MEKVIRTEFTFSGTLDAPYELHATVWKPENKKVDTVVQIAHGMTEHIGRYERLAEVLTKNGVAIAGFDFRGHGKNEGDKTCASLGENGWEVTIEDMHIYYEKLREFFPETRHFMYGFSMGTFLICDYLNKYPNDKIDGIILVGTGCQNMIMLSMVISLIRNEVKKAGWNNTSALVKKFSFDIYNDRYKPNRTYADWLCSDEEEIDAYVADELNRECVSSGLFVELLEAIRRSGQKDAFVNWNKDISVLLISGDDDMMGNKGKGMNIIDKNLRRCGIKNIQIEIVENARHDVLHERKNGAAETAEILIRDFLESGK